MKISEMIAFGTAAVSLFVSGGSFFLLLDRFEKNEQQVVELNKEVVGLSKSVKHLNEMLILQDTKIEIALSKTAQNKLLERCTALSYRLAPDSGRSAGEARKGFESAMRLLGCSTYVSKLAPLSPDNSAQ